MSAPLVVVVLAAGKGTRMRSSLPKVLHPVAGRPMIQHVLEAAASLDPAQMVVVIGPEGEAVAEGVRPHPVVVQREQLGTADAVKAAKDVAQPFIAEGADVLVLYGDGPLITADTLTRMRAARQAGEGAFIWLGFRPPDPTGYGRLLVDDAGTLSRIVEEKDASEAERTVGLCWAGLLLGEGAALFSLLEQVDNDNAKQEYYLTSLVDLAARDGLASAVVEGDADEVRGVNSRSELAEAEAILQQRLRSQAMESGVTLIAPETVYLSWDTQLAADVVVEPHVIFGPGVKVAAGAVIHGFSHIEGTMIEAGARIGPFARLRPGTRVGPEARVGNFVEMKATSLGAKAKANHLSYVGDAEVGEGANIGAGTITCNYDGFAKHRTVIGAGAFIGSNSSLVAPVHIGSGAVTGAGGTIVEDVPDQALAVARAEQTNRPEGAVRLRARREQLKEG